MEEELKQLKEQVEALTKEKETLEKSVAEKDAVIAQKNDDIVGQRKQYKRLRDMSQEEKDALSQKEIELQERMEAFEAEQTKFQEEQAAVQKKEAGARQDAAIARLVGENEEYAQKLRDNFNAIKDSEQAFTESEINALMDTAFNMLGDDKPAPVADALNASGNAPGDTDTNGFADSEAGKGLAKQMNLQQPEAPKAPETPAPEPTSLEAQLNQQ